MTRCLPQLGLTLCLVVGLTACGGGGGSTKSEKPATAPRVEKVKVGLLLDLVHERWERDRTLIKEVVADMGAELLVEAAEGDQARQIEQAKAMLDAGVKALLVVAHDTERAAPLVEAAKARQVPVISYDRLIRNADLALYIGFDTVKVGELQAQYLLTKAPKGNYLLIGGAPTDGNAKNVRSGQLKALEPAVKSRAIRIVGDGWAENWAAAEGAKLTEQALDKTRNKLAAVAASNDVLAGAAIGVLESRGLAGKVAVSGQDAELAAARRIVAGTQSMTVYKSLRTLTRLAARAVVMLAKGETPDTSRVVNNGFEDVPAMIFDPIAVDKDNLDGIVIGDGFLQRDAVYKGSPR